MYPKSGDISLPVDLIRATAIILVILLHASIEPNPTLAIMSPAGVQLWWTSNVFDSLARPAVPLFVMLTGALLLQPSKADEPLKVFFKKRLARIGLPLIFWGGAYFAWRYFVNKEALTSNSIFQGILGGPYFHFWFVYLLLGLYLITPILRVIVAHAKWNVAKYFLFLWFIGTGLIPLLGLYQVISPATTWFRQNIFIMSGMLGYFVLGAYFIRLRFRSSVLYIILALSFLWTILGTYLIVGTMGESYSQFFYDASSFNVIVASIALFTLLTLAPPVEKVKQVSGMSGVTRLVQLISKNTLPIYLFHVMVLETLQRGYLGFKISVTTMNPIVEIPLITILTLIICLAVLVPLKKIPHAKNILG